MKRILFISAVLGLLASPVVAQLPVEGTSRFITTVQPEIYVDNESGNQAWVREYDAEYDSIDIGALDSVGYSGPFQYDLYGYDLITGNRLFDMSAASGYAFSGNLHLSQLTHRLDWIPSPEPGLAPFTITGAPTPVDPRTTYISVAPFRDWTDMDRNQLYLNLGWRVAQRNNFRLVGEYWTENENGSNQIFWFGRTGSIAFQKAGSIRPIDRELKEPGIGFDSRLGAKTAFSYRFYATRFDGTPDGPDVNGLTNEPIRLRNELDTDTDTNDFRLASNLSDSLTFTGFLTLRDRSHKTAGATAFLGLPAPTTIVPSDVDADITTGNLAFDYMPGLDWIVTAKHYRSNYDLNSPIIPDPDGGIANQAMSTRDVRTALDAVYIGIRRWTLGVGYERRDFNRYLRTPHGPHEEFEHPEPADESTHNIFKFNATGRPGDRLSFRLGTTVDDVDDPGYHGTGSFIWDWNALLTYTPRVDTVFNASYYRHKEDNGQFGALPAIPDPLTDPTGYENVREAIAGAWYNNNYETYQINAWKALSNKVSLDLAYGRDKVKSSSLWIIGIDPGFLPHLPPFVAPFNAHSNIYSAGLTYDVNAKWRVRGDLAYVDSFGGTTAEMYQLIPGAPNPVKWTPLSMKDTKWSVSVGYALNPLTQLDLEFSAFNFNDNVDPANDGHFDVITLAAVRKF